VFKNRGGEVPVYLYGAIASLLLDNRGNEEVLLQIRTCFPDFHILAFAENIWLVKPVGYKLLYLHRIFAEGGPSFKRLLDNQEEVLRLAEECGGDIRHMRPYIGQVYVDRLFEMPVLSAERIVNLCPRAFKLSLQGAEGAEIFSEENKTNAERGRSRSGSPGGSETHSKPNGSDLTELMRECNFGAPDSETTANLYVTIYEEDHEDSISLMCGILASKYYINVKKYAQASELLTTIVPILRDLSYESEFMSFFLYLFRCWGELVYCDNAVEEIINKDRFASISELEANTSPNRFSEESLTFLHKATRKQQGRKCTSEC
jgi:hypothetical protein